MMLNDNDAHLGILVPASPLSEGGRPRPPTAKRPHLDWTPKRDLNKEFMTEGGATAAAICDGETVSGEGLTATQPDSAVSGALCATDLAGRDEVGTWQWSSALHASKTHLQRTVCR